MTLSCKATCAHVAPPFKGQEGQCLRHTPRSNVPARDRGLSSGFRQKRLFKNLVFPSVIHMLRLHFVPTMHLGRRMGTAKRASTLRD